MSLLGKSTSITAKLTRINLLVSATALLLACVSFFTYDLISVRNALIGSLTTEAQIIGANSVSALTFDDQQAADATLEALNRSPQVLSAAVVSPDGQVFATYSRDGESPTLSLPVLKPNQDSAQWWQGSNILVGSRIEFHGQTVGTVYILAETREVLVRARHYGMIAAAILLLCLLGAWAITLNYRRLLAGPLIQLAETARVVTTDRDYSIRAQASPEVEEVSTLVDSFNQMLGQIEQRDHALQLAKQELEQRVQERTRELTAANRELEAFSYSVAHDLRGPLDVIGNIGFLLQHSLREDEDASVRSNVVELLRGTQRMSALIDDLLNLSRASRSGLHTAPIDLSAMVYAIERTLHEGDPKRRVDFRVMQGAHGLADENLIRIVLENLLRNAWKYSSKVQHARIEFGFFGKDHECVYFVRDNGAGFDPKLADRLFQPFQRLHPQNEFPGTGIGLATVERIIRRHEGRVWAEGAVGEGTTVYFTLTSGRTPEAQG